MAGPISPLREPSPLLFQTTNSLDIVNIPCFEINIKQNSVYGQFQHEFIQYWFALIIHPDRRHSAQCACLRGILISINTNLDMSTAFKPGHKATKQINKICMVCLFWAVM